MMLETAKIRVLMDTLIFSVNLRIDIEKKNEKEKTAARNQQC